MVKLFPRKPGQAVNSRTAARAMAHRLLDALRRGEPIPDETIYWALLQTGDACPSRNDRHGDPR